MCLGSNFMEQGQRPKTNWVHWILVLIIAGRYLGLAALAHLKSQNELGPLGSFLVNRLRKLLKSHNHLSAVPLKSS